MTLKGQSLPWRVTYPGTMPGRRRQSVRYATRGRAVAAARVVVPRERHLSAVITGPTPDGGTATVARVWLKADGGVLVERVGW